MSVPTEAVDDVPFRPTSSVHCTNRSGFRFWNATDVVVANISFTYCGVFMYLPSTALTLILRFMWHSYIYTALAFDRVSHITTSGLIVQNSTGHGLVVTYMKGSVTVTKSAFISNGINKTYWGGNTLFNHYDDKQECSEASTTPFTLTVESSYFIHGVAASTIFTAGMRINIIDFCSDIHISINHSIFLGNHHEVLEGSGNLEMEIYEIHNSSVSQEIIIDNSYITGGISRTSRISPDLECAGISLWYFHFLCESLEHVNSSYLWKISNSHFVGNVALGGGSGGLSLGAECISLSHQIVLYNNTFIDNKAPQTDYLKTIIGVAQIHIHITKCVIRSVSNIVSPTIAIDSCTFQHSIGGGIHIELRTQSKIPGIEQHKHTLLQITDGHFQSNYDEEHSGLSSAISFGLDHMGTDLFLFELELNNCTFVNNSNPVLTVFLFRNIIRYRDFQPFAFIFQNVVWTDSIPLREYSVPIQDTFPHTDGQQESYSTVLLNNVRNSTFIDCEFQNNQNTALKVAGSILHFQRTTLFKGNTGYAGGAITVYNSYLFLKPNSTVLFINNSAFLGGALWVRQTPLEGLHCFFQVDRPKEHNIAKIGTHMLFEGNTATSAGSVLFGGHVDSCLQYFVKDYFSNGAQVLLTIPAVIFNQVFDYTSQHGLSVIASHPLVVCFCNSRGFPECEVQTIERDIFPGESFNVSTVVGGQRDGVVPGSVVAYFEQAPISHNNSIDNLQSVQPVSTVCTNLTYIVSSTNGMAALNLEVDSSAREGAIAWLYPPKVVEVLLKPCPLVLGFELSKITGRCECAHPLIDNHFTCTIQNRSIHRPGGVWIGYHSAENSSSGVLLHKHCPFDYCKHQDSDLNLEHPDQQCAFNRSGILCGACQSGLSLALGTSRCLYCSNAYITMFLVFALAGILLVLLLIFLNLTVSEGTLSGLIFYANIIHVNQAIFFRSDNQTSTTAARVFVAWLNLDLGIETCFFNGMDMYVKTWLQFIFPMYVWLIVLAMIISGHYSTIAARVFSRNAVKVLATLFLLAYAKLQRTIITAVSYTSMVYPDSSRRFHWLYDGNMRYLHGKHIPLFMAGVPYSHCALHFSAVLPTVPDEVTVQGFLLGEQVETTV